MSTDSDQQRVELRKRIIAQRDALSTEQLQAGARGLCQQLTATPEYRETAHIAAYWPVKGEADVGPLIDQARQDGKRVYLPIVGEDGLLRFAPYDADAPMKANRLGIPEPELPAEQRVSAREMEFVIVPLTVFDGFGNRLGMGGGFYDRTFAFLRDEPGCKRPLLVGAAHELQYTERLPTCPWDVPTHMVVTEQRVWRPAKPGAENGATAH